MTSGPIDKDKIVYQAGRGGDLLLTYEIARVNAQFASGAVENRNYSLGTTTTTAVAPFITPRDLFVTEIQAFVQNQTAGSSIFDVHVLEPGSGSVTQYTVLPLDSRPSIAGAVNVASGAFATATTIEHQEWKKGDRIYVYADSAGTNASGAVVSIVARTVST